MNNYIIQDWDASYYCWDDKVWKYGKLCVCSKCICFFENNSKMDEKPKISFDLNCVTGFQRRQVLLVFRAIVINVERLRPQWFSSLQNREETYYFLEHFWQQRLLLGLGYSRQSHQGKQVGTMSAPNYEERRRKLFEVLYDSENTLSQAADSLQNQGEKLDGASRTMNALHNDLTVAETLLNGLDRWFTKWDIKPEYFHEIDVKKEFPILYRKHVKESFLPGFLVMTQDQLSVLNAKRVVVASLLLKDLTSINVITPWNVTVFKSVIGEPDIMVDISSTHVVYIVKALQLKHSDKFEFEEPSSHVKQVANFVDEDSEVGSHHLTGSASSLVSGVQDAGVLPQSVNVEIQQQQQQKQQHQQRISDMDEADLETVSGVVGNIKSLAIHIGQEMSRQLDSLEQLSESVDAANHRIRQDSRKLGDKLQQ